MFTVGHVALDHLVGVALSRAMGQDLNVPITWTLSLLPDIDFVIPGLQHKGPTHSLIIVLSIFIPILLTLMT